MTKQHSPCGFSKSGRCEACELPGRHEPAGLVHGNDGILGSHLGQDAFGFETLSLITFRVWAQSLTLCASIRSRGPSIFA